MPTFERTETVKLRCVEIDPRHVSLTELEPDDCRYPYGGDQEGEASPFAVARSAQAQAIVRSTFSSDSRPGTASERSAGTSRSGCVEAA